MITETIEGRETINVVAYQLVKENAPDEIPLYVSIRNEYFKDPEKFGQSSDIEDEVLGFGTAEAADIFTRYLFPILTPILAYLVEEAKKAFSEDGGKKAIEWVKDIFSNKKPKTIFNQEQLNIIDETIADIISTESKKRGWKKNQVQELRDAIIRKLALAEM